MHEPVPCEELEDVLVDLATGAASAEERATALRHMALCVPCRHLAEDLVAVVDGLVLLAPGAEPPEGFEAAALASMTERERGPEPLPNGWRRRALVAAAAAVIFTAGVTSANLTGRRTARPTAAATAVGGVRTAELVGRSGSSWGEAYVHAGDDSWVFVSMRWKQLDGAFTVELAGPAIPSVRLEGLRLVGGQGDLGRSVPGDLANVRTLRVLDQLGREVCRASLD